MTRDEMLLIGLAEGEGSTADLMVFTGLPERTVRRGLRRLIGSGHVFSPIRGSYRLTSAGSAVVEELSPSPAPRIEHSRDPHFERDAAPSATGVPAWLWGGLLGAAAAALVLRARQSPQAGEPPPPGPGPLRVHPSGWRSAY